MKRRELGKELRSPTVSMTSRALDSRCGEDDGRGERMMGDNQNDLSPEGQGILQTLPYRTETSHQSLSVRLAMCTQGEPVSGR